jgi:hypothetical protein
MDFKISVEDSLFPPKGKQLHHFGLVLPCTSLKLLGMHCILTLFGEIKILMAQSELELDNARIQEQLIATQHPMLEDSPDSWEQSGFVLSWLIPNRLPWNKAMRTLALDTLLLSQEQCRAMDSLVKIYGRPTHAAFWMMNPWMSGQGALAFQRALDREFPNLEQRNQPMKSGIEFFYGTLVDPFNKSYNELALLQRWQYRIRHQFRNIGLSITLEKSINQDLAGIPGFFIQGKRGSVRWVIGDFHLQSENRLFHNTLRMPAFSNPCGHFPGSEILSASSRMISSNQVRGLGLQTSWNGAILVLRSFAAGVMDEVPYPLNTIQDSTTYNHNSLAWMHTSSLQMHKTWGVIGIQSALTSTLKIPRSWNPLVMVTPNRLFDLIIQPPPKFSDHLHFMGINYRVQKHNFFFQGNWSVHPPKREEPVNNTPIQGNSPRLSFQSSWDISQILTLVLTPHPAWSLGMRWTKLAQGDEIQRTMNFVWPKEGNRKMMDFNLQWSPKLLWSITLRSHWIEEGPGLGAGNSFMSWNRGLEGRILKGAFKESRYTILYQQPKRGDQRDYLFQYLRMPWPHHGSKEEQTHFDGFVQFAHGYSSPQKQTWAIAYNIFWKRIFHKRADLKVGQTWVIAGPEGERVTLREDQSFGAGWWTGSDRQYRFTASVQGRGSAGGWRLWARQIKQDDNLRWETGISYSQRWDEH